MIKNKLLYLFYYSLCAKQLHGSNISNSSLEEEATTNNKKVQKKIKVEYEKVQKKITAEYETLNREIILLMQDVEQWKPELKCFYLENSKENSKNKKINNNIANILKKIQTLQLYNYYSYTPLILNSNNKSESLEIYLLNKNIYYNHSENANEIILTHILVEEKPLLLVYNYTLGLFFIDYMESKQALRMWFFYDTKNKKINYFITDKVNLEKQDVEAIHISLKDLNSGSSFKKKNGTFSDTKSLNAGQFSRENNAFLKEKQRTNKSEAIGEVVKSTIIPATVTNTEELLEIYKAIIKSIEARLSFIQEAKNNLYKSFHDFLNTASAKDISPLLQFVNTCNNDIHTTLLNYNTYIQYKTMVEFLLKNELKPFVYNDSFGNNMLTASAHKPRSNISRSNNSNNSMSKLSEYLSNTSNSKIYTEGEESSEYTDIKSEDMDEESFEREREKILSLKKQNQKNKNIHTDGEEEYGDEEDNYPHIEEKEDYLSEDHSQHREAIIECLVPYDEMSNVIHYDLVPINPVGFPETIEAPYYDVIEFVEYDDDPTVAYMNNEMKDSLILIDNIEEKFQNIETVNDTENNTTTIWAIPHEISHIESGELKKILNGEEIPIEQNNNHQLAKNKNNNKEQKISRIDRMNNNGVTKYILTYFILENNNKNFWLNNNVHQYTYVQNPTKKIFQLEEINYSNINSHQYTSTLSENLILPNSSNIKAIEDHITTSNNNAILPEKHIAFLNTVMEKALAIPNITHTRHGQEKVVSELYNYNHKPMEYNQEIQETEYTPRYYNESQGYNRWQFKNSTNEEMEYPTELKLGGNPSSLPPQYTPRFNNMEEYYNEPQGYNTFETKEIKMGAKSPLENIFNSNDSYSGIALEPSSEIHNHIRKNSYRPMEYHQEIQETEYTPRYYSEPQGYNTFETKEIKMGAKSPLENIFNSNDSYSGIALEPSSEIHNHIRKNSYRPMEYHQEIQETEYTPRYYNEPQGYNTWQFKNSTNEEMEYPGKELKLGGNPSSLPPEYYRDYLKNNSLISEEERVLEKTTYLVNTMAKIIKQNEFINKQTGFYNIKEAQVDIMEEEKVEPIPQITTIEYYTHIPPIMGEITISANETEWNTPSYNMKMGKEVQKSSNIEVQKNHSTIKEKMKHLPSNTINHNRKKNSIMPKNTKEEKPNYRYIILYEYQPAPVNPDNVPPKQKKVTPELKPVTIQNKPAEIINKAQNQDNKSIIPGFVLTSAAVLNTLLPSKDNNIDVDTDDEE